MRKQKICASVLGLLILSSICFAQAGKEKKETNGPTIKTQTAKARSAGASKFVGTWKLVAIEGQQVPKRDRIGFIMYDTAGRMAVQTHSKIFRHGSLDLGAREIRCSAAFLIFSNPQSS